MRYIDPYDIELELNDPQWRPWMKKAKTALAEVTGIADPDARKKKIGKKQPVWAELSKLLGGVSNGKCWYCESKELRSDNPVDHFRPKGQVAEDQDHGGYWWLAFEWSNLRFGCTYCNSFRRSERTSGGKQDRFPLLNAFRARTPDEPWQDERPILLDPTDPEDPALLTFEGNGDAVPRYRRDADNETHCQQHLRAKESISIYHLNEAAIRKARWQRMRQVRKRLDRGWEIFVVKEVGDVEAEREWKECLSDLLRWKKRSSSFSSATLAELTRQRDNPLAREVLKR